MEYKEFYILRLDQWLSQNIRKNFFENNMGVFKVGGRKFHSPKYKGK